VLSTFRNFSDCANPHTPQNWLIWQLLGIFTDIRIWTAIKHFLEKNDDWFQNYESVKIADRFWRFRSKRNSFQFSVRRFSLESSGNWQA